MACAAMELYQENIRQFLKLFPRNLQSSEAKDAFYSEKSSYQALLRDKFITYNSADLISIIAIDIDKHQDGGVWADYDLPQPTWTVWTDRGVQLMWVLRKPILARVPEHRKMAKEVLAMLVYALDADINAMGFNRVFRNPLNNRSRYTGTRVDLKDFYLRLPKPSQEWWYKVNRNRKRQKRSKTETLFADTHTPTHAPVELKDFGTMKEGDGRNVALFDRLRFWAYDEAKAGRYDGHLLSNRALALNKCFLEPLSDKEVNGIINSIDNFIEFKYAATNTRGFGMSEEELKARASKAGSKAGKLKTIEARGRILSALNQFEMFEIKITISGVAKKAKAHKSTVSTYLKELGYTNKGGSIGWKRSQTAKEIREAKHT